MATASRSSDTPRRRSRGWVERRRTWTALAILLPPALLLFTLFVIIPFVSAGALSLFTYRGFGPVEDWQGVTNYVWILTRRTFNAFFEPAVRNTALILGASLLVQLPLALACALMLYRNTLVNSLFRLIFFLPFVLSEVATGLIWIQMFDGNDGVFAGLFRALNGGESYFILADKTWGIAAVLLVLVWKFFGYHMIIYIAGLQGVPKELIESAKVDGATELQTIVRVKIPLISYAIKLSVFFALLGSFQVFDLMLALYGASPPEHGQTLATFIYEWGFGRRSRYGIASAASVILFAFTLIAGFLYQRFVFGRDSMFSGGRS